MELAHAQHLAHSGRHLGRQGPAALARRQLRDLGHLRPARSGFRPPTACSRPAGRRLSPNEFRLAYDRQLQLLSQQFGQRISREQASALGIDQQVLAQLAAGAVLDEQAREHGPRRLQGPCWASWRATIRPSRAPAATSTASSSSMCCGRSACKPDDYLQQLRAVGARQQISRGRVRRAEGAGCLPASGGALSRRGPHGRLSRAAAVAGASRSRSPMPTRSPNGSRSNKKTYAAPEYRKIAYLKLEPEDIADPAADHRRAGQGRTTTRTRPSSPTPETRTHRAARLRDARGGQGGARVDPQRRHASRTSSRAKARPLADVALGTFAKDKVPDPAVADAAFGLQAKRGQRGRRRQLRPGAACASPRSRRKWCGRWTK